MTTSHALTYAALIAVLLYLAYQVAVISSKERKASATLLSFELRVNAILEPYGMRVVWRGPLDDTFTVLDNANAGLAPTTFFWHIQAIVAADTAEDRDARACDLMAECVEKSNGSAK